MKKPDINAISREIAGQSNFEERLAYYEHKKQQKEHEKQKREEKENQQLYRPQINQSSKRRMSEIPVTDRLYAHSKKQLP